MKRGPLKLFYSYAHEDEAYRNRIDEHLELLRRRNLIVGWHDRHIVPGSEWKAVIDESLETADIVLLLVTESFLASDFINEVEIPAAMAAHQSGRLRVVPVLLEEVEGWQDAPFEKLQILPTDALPVAKWDDAVHAYHDIAAGVERVAKDIIVAGGGPFEFGAHEFHEAELAVLPRVERQRTEQGLCRLRASLNDTIPPRQYESNLIVATWALNKFGRSHRLGDGNLESLFYMAQLISSFDLVALQEVDRNLGRLQALLGVLGPDWKMLVTDIAPGMVGNSERFAFLYYEPRVEFLNFSSQVILPPERMQDGGFRPARQFERPPAVAAFRSGEMEFQVCTAHIACGSGRPGAEHTIRLEEIRMLGAYLKTRSRYNETEMLLLGNFQMERLQSPITDALRENGVQVPEELLHPTNFNMTKYYDLIGFTSPNRTFPLGRSETHSGSVNIFEHVFRDEDIAAYVDDESFANFAKASAGGPKGKSATTDLRRFMRWKITLISDHLPLWAELDVRHSADA